MIEGFELYIFYNIRSINTFQLLWKRGECLCVVVTLCLLLPSLGWELNGDYRKYCRALSYPQPQRNRLTDSGSHFATLVYRKYVILPLSQCFNGKPFSFHVLLLFHGNKFRLPFYCPFSFLWRGAHYCFHLIEICLHYSCNGCWLFMRSVSQ